MVKLSFHSSLITIEMSHTGCQYYYTSLITGSKNYGGPEKICWGCFSLLQQSGVVFLLVGMHLLLDQWVHGLEGTGAEGFRFLLPAISGALIWPTVFLRLRSIRRTQDVRGTFEDCSGINQSATGRTAGAARCELLCSTR